MDEGNTIVDRPLNVSFILPADSHDLAASRLDENDVSRVVKSAMLRHAIITEAMNCDASHFYAFIDR